MSIVDSYRDPIQVREFAVADLDTELARRGAIDTFADYRRFIRPHMTWNWWTEDVANHMQQFYEDFAAGKRPWLAIEAPPQHGKSWAATDFIGWVSGKNPNCKTIFGSYSDDLGVRTNLDLQRMMASEQYRSLFPQTRINQHGWVCNSSLIEFAGHVGSFRNTTVNGSINGMELHLGVIDDPVKGRMEASSPTTRKRTWEWFADDFLSRFAANSALLVIMTRWNVDDILGRLEKKDPGRLKVLKYPAVALRDEEHRAKGDALFPQLKSLDFLLQRKAVLTQASWESLYQQSPIVVGGGQIPIEKFRVLPYWSHQSNEIAASVRYWDCASSLDKDASRTAGVLMHRMTDGRYVISHIVHGQFPALERENKIKFFADLDSKLYGSNYEIMIEQEPGSAGKDRVEQTIVGLAGYRAYADKVTGAKAVRNEPFVAAVQNSGVWFVAGDWISAFIEECEAWTGQGDAHDDQVDAAGGAFGKLVKATSFDTSYSWV